jgi:hypothetical protein
MLANEGILLPAPIRPNALSNGRNALQRQPARSRPHACYGLRKNTNCRAPAKTAMGGFAGRSLVRKVANPEVSSSPCGAAVSLGSSAAFSRTPLAGAQRHGVRAHAPISSLPAVFLGRWWRLAWVSETGLRSQIGKCPRALVSLQSGPWPQHWDLRFPSAVLVAPPSKEIVMSKRPAPLTGLLAALVPIFAGCGGADAEMDSQSESLAQLTAAATAGGIRASGNEGSNLCLDARGNTFSSGTPVQLWECHGGDNQAFAVKAEAIVIGGNSCLSVAGGRNRNGTSVRLQACDASKASQKWQRKGSALQWAGTDKCLDVADGHFDNGTTLQIYSCDSSNKNQQFADVGSSSAPAAKPSNSAGSGPLKALSAKGSQIVDSSGKAVNLHGTNLGGWLVLENWMCGIEDKQDPGLNNSIRYRFALNTLESRFGEAKANALFDAWQDNFLTEKDFDRLQKMGVNVVRVPFHWRTLQNKDRSWRTRSDGQIDFRRLDWVVDQAAKHQMYVIPTFHIWVGQKAQYSRISENTREGASDRGRAVDIWKAVSKHFKGNNTVAGFDIINEPTGSWGNILQESLYQAVRSEDASRMVIMESVGASPKSMNWTNVVYSFHQYSMMGQNAGDNRSAYEREAKTFAQWKDFPVPVYIGEFMAQPDAGNGTLDYMLKHYNDGGFAWTNWTYKGVNNGGWAFYNYPGSLRISVDNDSYDHIMNAWTHMPEPQANEQVINRYKSYWR